MGAGSSPAAARPPRSLLPPLSAGLLGAGHGPARRGPAEGLRRRRNAYAGREAGVGWGGGATVPPPVAMDPGSGHHAAPEPWRPRSPHCTHPASGHAALDDIFSQTFFSLKLTPEGYPPQPWSWRGPGASVAITVEQPTAGPDDGERPNPSEDLKEFEAAEGLPSGTSMARACVLTQALCFKRGRKWSESI